MTVTVMYDDREAKVTGSARDEGDRLWLTAGDLAEATGWTLKPEGLCRDEACVPLPADGSWRDEEGRIDLAALARREGRPEVRDEEHAIWSFGQRVSTKPAGPQAPDFALPDLDGELHSLSDHRGRKIFLYAWGSF